jgi:hypothetical protein
MKALEQIANEMALHKRKSRKLSLGKAVRSKGITIWRNIFSN